MEPKIVIFNSCSIFGKKITISYKKQLSWGAEFVHELIYTPFQ